MRFMERHPVSLGTAGGEPVLLRIDCDTHYVRGAQLSYIPLSGRVCSAWDWQTVGCAVYASQADAIRKLSQ